MKNPMTLDEQLAVMQAKRDGIATQFRNYHAPDPVWADDFHTDHIGFNFQSFEYRVAPFKLQGWVAVFDDTNKTIGLYGTEFEASKFNLGAARIILMREV